MIHLVYRHAFGDDVEDKRVKMLALVATFLLVFFFSPVYGQVMLWESGATNYLWNLVLILLYLLPMRLYADGREDESPVGKHTPLYALLSLIAGCTNENTGAGVVCLSLALLWQAHKKYGRVNRRYLASTALFVIGYIALVAAPGNYARKNSYAGIREASTFRQIESAIAGTANLYIDAKALLIPLVIFLAFMAYDYVYEKTFTVIRGERNIGQAQKKICGHLKNAGNSDDVVCRQLVRLPVQIPAERAFRQPDFLR